MDLEQARKELIALQEKMSAYNHAMGLLSYDGETTAPAGTAANRGHSMGILSEIMYKLSTGKETVELLEFLDAHKEELNQKEQRMVYLLLKDIRFMQKIPMDEYVKTIVELPQNGICIPSHNNAVSFFSDLLDCLFLYLKDAVTDGTIVKVKEALCKPEVNGNIFIPFDQAVNIHIPLTRSHQYQFFIVVFQAGFLRQTIPDGAAAGAKFPADGYYFFHGKPPGSIILY